MQLEWMSRPRSSAISAMCAKEIETLRYHRTHQRMISPDADPLFHAIAETIARIEEMPDQIVLMRREGKPKDKAGLTSPSRRASRSARQAPSRPCSGIWHQSPHRAPRSDLLDENGVQRRTS